jgi:hypothetical protein
MPSVLTAIVHRLQETPDLMDSLEGGDIWDVTQPSDDQTLPTITLLWEENALMGRSKGQRLGRLIVDIWDVEGSTERLERIRNEVEFALDRRVIVIDDKHVGRCFIGAEAQVPTEVNENLVHWTMDFDVRYWRQAWVQRILSE